jgi:hypothetical protein
MTVQFQAVFAHAVGASRRAVSFLSCSFVLLAISACSSSGASRRGAERQPCLDDSTCDPGLTCLSGLCVNASPDGAAGTAGGGIEGSDASITPPPTGGTTGTDGSTLTAPTGTGGGGLGGSTGTTMVGVGGAGGSGPGGSTGTTVVGSGGSGPGGRTGTTVIGSGGSGLGGSTGTTVGTGGTPTPACGAVPVTTTPAAVPNGQLTVPTARPRLWWTPERLAAARTWVKTHPITFDAGDMEEEDHILPALSYLLTDNKAHAKLAVDWALALRVNPVDSQDQYRWYGEVAILIYDWCYSELTAEQRQAMRDRWDGYVKTGNQQSWGGPDMPESNYYWGYLRNSLEWGIATYGESTAAQGFIDNALVTRWQGTFLAYAAKDASGGVPPEGSQYGRYLFGYPLVPFATMSQNGRGIYDETLFWKQSVYALIYATPPTATTRAGRQTWDMFGYSDDEKWVEGDSARNADWGDTMQSLANQWPTQTVGQHAQQWVNQVNSKLSPWVAGVGSTATSAGFEGLPLDYFAPGSGFFYLRNRWGSGATVMLLQLGYPLVPGNHQHTDVGTFQIWRSGRWLSRESVAYGDPIAGPNGSGSVEAYLGPAHNLILFNGAGPPFSDTKGPPEVKRLESQARYAYAATDLSKAYRSTDTQIDNPSVSSIVREYLYVRDLDSLVMLDRLVTSSDQVEKIWLLHSETQPQLNTADRRITLTNGDQTLDARVLAPSAPTIRTVDERDAQYGQYRVEVVDTGSRESYFLTVLSLGTGSSAVTATGSETADQFTVTLANPAGTPSSVQVVFNKGATSTGGSIAFDQDAAVALRTSVQPISLTSCGPAWGN